jgi:hypothetical protein
MASWLSNAAFLASIPAAVGSIAFWMKVAAAQGPAAIEPGANAPPVSALDASADHARLTAVLKDQAEFSAHAAFWTAVTLFLQTLSTSLKYIAHLNAPPPIGIGL